MATLRHCGLETKASVYRLASKDKRFKFQILFHSHRCKGNCGLEVMRWKGETETGGVTDFFDIPRAEYQHWQSRIEVDKARPELQLISEYTKKMCGDINAQARYQEKLAAALRFYR